MKKLLFILLLLFPTISFAIDGVGFGGGTPVTDSPIAATNWIPDIDAVQLFEEASGNALDSGINGDDDFTATGAARNTGWAMEGTNSADVLDAVDYFSCADASCPGIDPAAGDSATYACWINLDTLPTVSSAYFNWKKNGATTGHDGRLAGTTAGDPFRCISSNTTNIVATNDLDNPTAISTPYHHACVMEDQGTNLVVTSIVNARWGTSNSDALDYAPSTSTTYLGAANTGGGADGKIDECFFDKVPWTSDELARACSGNLSGQKLKCSSSTPTNYYACDNNTDCGGSGICDTGATAKDDPYCVEGTKAGCCMGINSTICHGVDLTPCNAGAPTL